MCETGEQEFPCPEVVGKLHNTDVAQTDCTYVTTHLLSTVEYKTASRKVVQTSEHGGQTWLQYISY